MQDASCRSGGCDLAIRQFLLGSTLQAEELIKWAPALKKSRWPKEYSEPECNTNYLAAIKLCIKRTFDRVPPALFLIQYYSVLQLPPQVYIEQYFFPTVIHVPRGVKALLLVNIKTNLLYFNLPRFSLPCSIVDLMRNC